METVPLAGLGGGGADGNDFINNVELDGTDLNFTGTGGAFSGTVSLLGLGGGDDNQQLTLQQPGNQLTLEDGGTPIDLTPFLDNTDAQSLSLTGDFLNISGGTGVDLAPILGGDDNQTAAEVPFTPSAETTSNNVQDAIDELQIEISGISATGTNPNDELNNRHLLSTGPNLEITDAAGTLQMYLYQLI